MRAFTFSGVVASFLAGTDDYDMDLDELLKGDVRFSLFRQGDADVPYWLRKLSLQELLSTVSGISIHRLVSMSEQKPLEIHSKQCITVIESRYGQPVWFSVHPEFSTDLRCRFLRWLSEPMPETWIMLCDDRNIHDPSGVVPVLTLSQDTYGLFSLGLDANRVMSCISAWKVCDAGTTRLELLKRAERIMSHPLNPYTSRLAPDASAVSMVIHFRPDRYWRYWSPRTLVCSVFPGKQAAVADMLTLLASKLGYTTLSPSDLSALIATWGIAAAVSHKDVDPHHRPKNSPLLMSHFLSSMSPDELELTLSLINTSTGNRSRRSGPGSRRIDTDFTCNLADVRFVSLVSIGHRVTHRTIFDAWMVARSQLGLTAMTYEELDYEGYVSLVTDKPAVQAECR